MFRPCFVHGVYSPINDAVQQMRWIIEYIYIAEYGGGPARNWTDDVSERRELHMREAMKNIHDPDALTPHIMDSL